MPSHMPALQAHLVLALHAGAQCSAAWQWLRLALALPHLAEHLLMHLHSEVGARRRLLPPRQRC